MLPLRGDILRRGYHDANMPAAPPRLHVNKLYRETSGYCHVLHASRTRTGPRQLVRKISRENPLWGAPRIHGELLKLGIDIGETSVGKYIVRRRKPPSQDWRTFLKNHVKTMVSVDFFSAPQGRRSPVGEGPTQVVVGRT